VVLVPSAWPIAIERYVVPVEDGGEQPLAVEEDHALLQARASSAEAAQRHLQVHSAIGSDPELWPRAQPHHGTRRDDIEKAMEESLMEVVPKPGKRTHYLATFANIATLLGLLGTVIGLIQAFPPLPR
jgi:biopolymer transport protein ExbB/TolQ